MNNFWPDVVKFVFTSTAIIGLISWTVKELIGHALKRELVSREEELRTASQVTIQGVKNTLDSDSAKRLEAYKNQLARESNTLLEAYKSQLATASTERIEMLRSELQRDLQLQLEIAKARQPAYKTLWALMLCTKKFDPIPLGTEVRAKFAADLTAWYYENGNGMFLSIKAKDRFLKARELLNAHPLETDAAIRDAFGALRTEMAIDLAIYNSEAWLVSIGPKSSNRVNAVTD